MRTWQENEQLLRRFQDWLAETGTEIDAARQSSDQTEPAGVGLLQLVEAFTALRHELKLQTKSSRGVVDSVQAALAGLDESTRQFRSVQPRENEAAERATRPFVESLIVLDEALQRGLSAIETSLRQSAQQTADAMVEALDRQYEKMPAWRRWWYRGWHAEIRQLCRQSVIQEVSQEIDVLLEGYRLICARLARELSDHQIRRIKSLGQGFDPLRMTVVELAAGSQAKPNTVTEEVRPGYMWRDKVVRFAEVRVARGHPSHWDQDESPMVDRTTGPSPSFDQSGL